MGGWKEVSKGKGKGVGSSVNVGEGALRWWGKDKTRGGDRPATLPGDKKEVRDSMNLLNGGGLGGPVETNIVPLWRIKNLMLEDKENLL